MDKNIWIINALKNKKKMHVSKMTRKPVVAWLTAFFY